MPPRSAADVAVEALLPVDDEPESDLVGGEHAATASAVAAAATATVAVRRE
jgi:hypothetical protein